MKRQTVTKQKYFGNQHLTQQSTKYKVPKDAGPTPHFPHKPDTKVTLLNGHIPTVVISKKAMEKMAYYCGLMTMEIGWFCTVDVQDEHVYYIDDAYVFEQEVHATTTEINEVGFARWCEKLMKDDMDQAMNLIPRLRCWGHSHVEMGVTPSGQDDKQMKDFGVTVDDYMIRIIANKKGALKVDIWDYARGFIWTDVSWSIEEAEFEKTDIRNEISTDHVSSSIALCWDELDEETIDLLMNIHQQAMDKKDSMLNEMSSEIEDKVTRLAAFAPNKTHKSLAGKTEKKNHEFLGYGGPANGIYGADGLSDYPFYDSNTESEYAIQHDDWPQNDERQVTFDESGWSRHTDYKNMHSDNPFEAYESSEEDLETGI